MRCGVCTSDIRPADADTIFSKMKRWGFECTQLSFTSITECGYKEDGRFEIPWSVSDGALKKISDASEKYGIPIEIINGTFNMAHPDPAVRDEGIARFGGFAKAVHDLGVRMISLCSGTRNTEYLWSPSELNETDGAWNDMAVTMSRAVEIAEKYGITLAIETEASNVISTPEKARKIMDDIRSPNLKMILDLANLFHKGTAKRENVRPTIKHAVDVFGKDVAVLHGKDIKEGPGIEFCGTGEGIVDFGYAAGLLGNIGYKGDMFLHGIFDEDKYVSAREFWQSEERKGAGE